MLFYLHKHLEETPKEKLDEKWKEIEESGVGSDSPTVDEYFASLNPQYQFAKGYSEGGKIFREKMEGRLHGDERLTIPVSEVVAMLKDIYENE